MRPPALRRAAAICCWLVSTVCPVTVAQAPGARLGNPERQADSAAIENAGAPVEVDGRPVLVVYARIGGFTPKERAELIERRIIALARKSGIAPETIHAVDRGPWTEILAGDDRLMGITDADADAAEKTRPELAAEYTEVIRQVVKQYRVDHTWPRVLWAALYTVLATAVLVGLLILLFSIGRSIRSRLETFVGRTSTEGWSQPVVRMVRRYIGAPVLALSRLAFWILVLALAQSYATLVLRFFPATRYTSYQITNWLFSELANFGKMVIAYIPNLVLVILICVITSYLIKVNQYFFSELRDQRLTIRGFYPDWAEPTAKLVRGLIITAAAIVIFPYLPGSNSPAFKGISVFLGVLLSLGSTSAVAHGVAGTILTYMRAFQVGDFVKIGSDIGEVVEKTFLVTRIRTQKDEVVTIPNGTVLGGVVVNYSAEARNKGVIFHTTVTIGYNSPWRQVHELLISAALATDDVLREPPPFVLQAALNDFYVAYELNAYTARPSNMQYTYSALHQNIQDAFNEAGVEINSPHFTSLRDGNRVTIPDTYVPRDYESPVFQVRTVNDPLPPSDGKPRG